MIANLPLLFSDGNPMSLPAMSVDQLERFITFMVSCSWGHDTAREIRKPAWWPHDVSFSHPFKRPSARISPDLRNRLRRLVQRCYEYHKSSFLLSFSAQLASYSRKRLKYVNNDDRTTSLIHEPTGRLLVTFRNENISYDKDQPSTPPPATDIYLCDYCDDHFDNAEALKVHERLCYTTPQPTVPNEVSIECFLETLGLFPTNSSHDFKPNLSPVKTRRNQTRAASERVAPYPFSSLAGRKMVKEIQAQHITALRERTEKYCTTSTISRSSARSTQFPIKYKKPNDYWTRYYRFPDQRNKKLLDIKAQLALIRCRDISVPIERLSKPKTEYYLERLDKLQEELEIEARRKQQMAQKKMENDQVTEIIDLCSDDDDADSVENRDPAKWQQIVRGGATIRRTSSPIIIADDNNKQRSNNMMNMNILRSPIILFSQSLANVISID